MRRLITDRNIFLGASIAIAAFAWGISEPDAPAQTCGEPEVVRFPPMQEVTPLVRALTPYDWPILDRHRIEIEPETVERVAEDDVQEDRPRRHHRRHYRRRWG